MFLSQDALSIFFEQYRNLLLGRLKRHHIYILVRTSLSVNAHSESVCVIVITDSIYGVHFLFSCM